MENVEPLLRQRGYEFSADSENVLIQCPFHNDENPSLSVHLRLGVFKCFSCEESGHFVKLIAAIDGITQEEAHDVVYLGFNPTDSIAELSNLINGEKQVRARYVNENRFFSTFPAVSGIFRKYLNRRKIGRRAIETFQIRCCYEGKYRNRVVIPIFDRKGRMVSFTARTIFQGVKPKTRKLKSSKVLRTALFGYREMPQSTSVVLVEGELDCIYLQQFGIPAVALMGKVLSDERIETIVDSFDYAFISYDNDEFGREAADKHLDVLREQMPASKIVLPKGCDPNDLSVDQVMKYYREVIPNKSKVSG